MIDVMAQRSLFNIQGLLRKRICTALWLFAGLKCSLRQCDNWSEEWHCETCYHLHRTESLFLVWRTTAQSVIMASKWIWGWDQHVICLSRKVTQDCEITRAIISPHSPRSINSGLIKQTAVGGVEATSNYNLSERINVESHWDYWDRIDETFGKHAANWSQCKCVCACGWWIQKRFP